MNIIESLYALMNFIKMPIVDFMRHLKRHEGGGQETIIKYLVQQIGEKIWKNCAVN